MTSQTTTQLDRSLWARGEASAACRHARRVSLLGLLVLLLFMPHHPGVLWLFGRGPVRYWKEAVFAAALAACCVCLAARRGRPRVYRTAVLVAGGYVAAVGVRAAIGWYEGQDAWLLVAGAVNAVCFVPGFLIAAEAVERLAQLRRALLVVLCVAALAGALSVVDWAWGLSERFGDFGREAKQIIPYARTARRSQLTFESPMVLGMFVGMGLLIGAWLSADRSRATAARLAAAACMLVCLAGMFLTFSRGPLVSCLAGTAVVWMFSREGLTARSLKRGNGARALVVIALLYAAALTVWLMPRGWQQHLASTFNWLDDRHNVTRLRRMQYGLDLFAERPVVGHGMGAAQPRFTQYRVEQLGADPFYTNPESMFLLLAVEGGVLLLGTFLAVFALMLAWTVQLARPPNPPPVRRLAVLLLGVQTALLLESAIMPMLDTRTFKLGFWVLFGAVLWLRAYGSAPAAVRRGAASGSRRRGRERGEAHG